MKKALLAILSILLVFTGCKKYEDGPAFTLRTKKARLSNVWVIEAVYENGVDKSSDYKSYYSDYKLTINKDNTYSLNYHILSATDYSESGTWAFSDNKEHVYFTSSSASADWTILRLKERQFWGSYSYVNTSGNTVTIEMQLTPKYE